MPITDGWLNVFRLTADDPIQQPDANFASVHDLFGGDGPASWLATTVDDAIAAMDRTGTERALISVSSRTAGRGGRTSEVELGSVEFGLEACRRHPDRFRLVLQLVDVSSPHGAAQLVHEVGGLEQVVAVGIFPADLGHDLHDRRLYPAYSACVDEGLAVRINVGIAGPPRPSRHQHPELLEELLIDFPDLTVIASHMGHPWEQVLIRLIMKFPHLHLLTSAYLPKYFHPDLVQFMGSSRGRGRVFFGSDHPGIPLDRALDEARKLPIDESALELFLGNALCDVLGWN